MTSLIALLLTLAALAAIAHPLLTRRGAPRLQGAESQERELEERYRSALADLRDAELDRELGNLSEEQFIQLRERYRRNAALALRALDEQRGRREALRARVAAELAGRGSQGEQPGSNGHAPSLPGHDANGRVIPFPLERVAERGRHGERALPEREAAHITALPPQRHGAPVRRQRAGRGSPSGLRAPLLLGGAIAVLATVGIAAFYFRSVSLGAAQAPLSTLTAIRHPHGVYVDESGGFVVLHHDGLLVSPDGRAWEPRAPGTDVMALARPRGTDRALIFGHDVLLESTDGARTWTALAHNLPGTDVHGAGAGTEALYAYVVGFGLYQSRDGRAWQQLGGDLGQDVAALAVQPGPTADRLYMVTGSRLIRSTDSGRTWASAAGAGNGTLNGIVRAVAADSVSEAVYAGTSDGLYRSTSAGGDWVRLPFRGAVAAVGVRGERIAVVDDQRQFFVSFDGGGTWLAQ